MVFTGDALLWSTTLVLVPAFAVTIEMLRRSSKLTLWRILHGAYLLIVLEEVSSIHCKVLFLRNAVFRVLLSLVQVFDQEFLEFGTIFSN